MRGYTFREHELNLRRILFKLKLTDNFCANLTAKFSYNITDKYIQINGVGCFFGLHILLTLLR